MRKIIPQREKSLIFELSEMQPTNKCGLLFLSQETVLIAHKFISFYGYWRSRYVIDAEANPMLGLTDAEYLDVQDTIDRALEELDMSQCDDLIIAVQNLVTEVQNVNSNLVDIKASIDALVAAQSPLDQTLIDDVEDALDGIGVILGAASVLGGP